MAQDSGFSFPQQRFETAWGYKKDQPQGWSFFSTASKGIKKINREVGFFCNRDKGYKKDQPQGWSFFQPRQKV
uniref:Putative Sel1-like repeat-containing protein n=1 Tax=uncultured bacterium Ad_125_H07_contig2 TaxID=1489300 RepID=A0A0B4N0D0_9BACT|nr:putative Sel1-like repeat-containing protein [uncultured bacterium Ad_125_H07_contig2]